MTPTLLAEYIAAVGLTLLGLATIAVWIYKAYKSEE